MGLQLMPARKVKPPAQTSAAFVLNQPRFCYDPYPIGVARPVFGPSRYEKLIESWPSSDLFLFMPGLGNKYSLSELNNPHHYYEFLRSSPVWYNFYRYVKTEGFIRTVLETLKSQQIDLNLLRHPISTTHALSPAVERWWVNLRGRVRRWFGHAGVLRSRFEFSMLPADGGHIKPHTDAPQKLITLIISMVRPGEWDPAWGGATAVLRPKDITANFNLANQVRDFELFDTIGEYPYEPNQCVIFIKTFNSHHAVFPMTAPANTAMRRTLTINIERVIT